MVVLAISVLGIAGLVVLVAALVVLLVSLLHPEGLRRPGGYLDGQEPQPDDRDDADA
ncbi:MAG TPA: hypothetical protein VFF79_15315 [Conexibacter sp.]|jgi:hypothetical protein|nr:hypothetical protein [Conexibacter sp.]